MNIDSAVILQVLLGVGLFTAVILVLVFVILVARSKLVATGEVAIVVNDEKNLAVHPGGKLLQALADSDLFVPSACGGGGTCGQCKVQIGPRPR
ncbi:MAG: 2Fe-2S iron-sulfur cluster-binding protein [Woeseiaceae bacterium]